MLKAAIEKIAAMAMPEVHTIEGGTFVIGPDGASQVRAHLDITPTLTLNSLDALVKMVRIEGIEGDDPLYITIPAPTVVRTYTSPRDFLREQRHAPFEVQATDVPGWDANVQMGFEEAMIALRTRFQDSHDIEYALKLLSDITLGAKVTYNDNGIATSVVTQSGVALQQNSKIRPIIKLRPYRTFQEVDQPESEFLIRVNERGIKFVEADGGMWRLAARKTIKEYLEAALVDEIHNGAVVVTL